MPSTKSVGPNMSMKQIQDILSRASGVLRAAGAKQAADVAAVAKLIGDSPDGSIDELVAASINALRQPGPAEMTAKEMAAQLYKVGDEKVAFDQLYSAISQRQFSKEKAFEIAGLYTGAGPKAWRSKSDALKAIKRKFDERVYLEAKSRLNDEVTPW